MPRGVAPFRGSLRPTPCILSPSTMSPLTTEAVHAAEPGLASTLTNWLEAGQLPLPAGFSITASMVSEGAEVARPEGTIIFETDELEIRSASDEALTGYWRRAPARAMVHPTRPELTLETSPAAMAEGGEFFRLFFMNLVVLALKRGGLYHLHAATARDPTGEDWVLVGDSFSGKSTTAALLTRRGWQVGTDDMSFLHMVNGDVAVTAWRSRIALREGGRELLRSTGGTPIPERGKQGFFPEELGGKWIQTVTPQYLLFPVVGGETSYLEPVPAGEVIRRILPATFWVLFERWGADEYLATLRRLAEQTRAFDLHLAPDLISRPGALRELLP